MGMCRWCKGTGGECGCGEGRCMHCNATGETADPPFGGEIDIVQNVLPEADVRTLANYWADPRRDENLGEFIQRVAMRAVAVGRTDCIAPVRSSQAASGCSHTARSDDQSKVDDQEPTAGSSHG